MTHFSQLTSPKKTQKWLQIGDRTLLESINPVRVEENSPLASDIITEQRKRINKKRGSPWVLNLSQFMGLFFTLFLFPEGGWWASGR